MILGNMEVDKPFDVAIPIKYGRIFREFKLSN